MMSSLCTCCTVDNVDYIIKLRINFFKAQTRSCYISVSWSVCLSLTQKLQKKEIKPLLRPQWRQEVVLTEHAWHGHMGNNILNEMHTVHYTWYSPLNTMSCRSAVFKNVASKYFPWEWLSTAINYLSVKHILYLIKR